MKSVLTTFRKLTLQFLPLLLVFLGLDCTLPSYDNPQPGTMEIHLKSTSHNIPYTALNNFILKVTEARAVREDGSELIVYQDVKAIDRKATVLNTLDSSAYKGDMVIGQTVAPVARYVGIALLIEPGTQLVLDGYRFIPVATDKTFDPLLVFPGSFTISEGKTTIIELTIDLDATLQKGADNYYFRPKYFISAIR